MANFLDSLSERSSQWFDGLTEREKRLLSIFFISMCFILVFSTLYLAIHKLNTKRAKLNHNQEQLVQVKELEHEYLKAKEQNERAIERIKRNSVSLFSLVQSITTRLGLSVKDINPQTRPLAKTNIVEISVRINLTRLSIDKLTALIEAIETSEEAQDLVKVTRLKINKRFDDPELLDLVMTVATWKTA